MLVDMMRMQSAKSRMLKILQDKRPGFFSKTLQERKKEKKSIYRLRVT